MKTINATEFKARCLAILDEVAATGEPVTILKRGRRVAQLLPWVDRSRGHPQAALAGSVEILGDVVEPPLPAEAWEAEGGGR
ncbi:MAG: type II toxin-antitoxin system Phd/YefM family antitoxin [Nitrospirae bacterium]|nr:MAG: type II toxin-antitoxin system Phd/YefM family antitoxin [Nitrospirota bacterium]